MRGGLRVGFHHRWLSHAGSRACTIVKKGGDHVRYFSRRPDAHSGRNARRRFMAYLKTA